MTENLETKTSKTGKLLKTLALSVPLLIVVEGMSGCATSDYHRYRGDTSLHLNLGTAGVCYECCHDTNRHHHKNRHYRK